MRSLATSTASIARLAASAARSDPRRTDCCACSCRATVSASSVSAKPPRALVDACAQAASYREKDRPDTASSIRRALFMASLHSAPASSLPGAPPANTMRSATVFGSVSSSPRRAATRSSDRNARTSSCPTDATRTDASRERTVGSSPPASLDVRIRVVSAGGSSRSFRNAFAACSEPSWGTMRSASPMMNTLRLAIAGENAACCTIARTVAM